MRVKLPYMLAFAAVVAAGCDRAAPESAPADAASRRTASGLFAPFDAAGITNVDFTSASGMAMGYSSLDGNGEWKWIYEPSEDATAEDALAYIEKTCTACDAAEKDAIVALYLEETRLPGSLEAHGDFAVWKAGDELYLVVESATDDPADVKECDFVICDGRHLRRLVPFATLPSSDKIWECARQARTNPAALNNIAAMIYNDVAKKRAVMAEHIGVLLRMAGSVAEPMACRNLAVYYASPLAKDADKDRKRDFWLRRAGEAVKVKADGLAPALKRRTVEEWPR